MKVHPAADIWPMLPDDELRRLAESIKANGLLEPIVTTPAGQLLDGRNRLAACKLARVKPTTIVHDGDPIAYILARNNDRRHMTTGQRAMATALTLAHNGHRANGRFRRGSVPKLADPQVSDWAAQVARCGAVLDDAPDLAPLVVAGTVALSAAHTTALERRRHVDDEHTRMARLDADAPDLAAHVRDEILSLRAAETELAQRETDRAERIRRNASYLRRVIEGWQLALTISSMPDLEASIEMLADDERAVLAEVVTRVNKETR